MMMILPICLKDYNLFIYKLCLEGPRHDAG